MVSIRFTIPRVPKNRKTEFLIDFDFDEFEINHANLIDQKISIFHRKRRKSG